MESDKTSWPELEGMDVDQAVQLIKEENTDLTVHKIEEGSMVTADYRTDRVRVFYNVDTNTVAGTPRIG